MKEPVVIDRIPVVLTDHQQKLWDEGHKRKVRRKVRESRSAKLLPEDEYEFMPDFDEEFGDDD